MLETLDLSANLSKSEHKEAMNALDPQLAQRQRDLHAAGIPVLLVFEGWDASGKGTTISRLLQPLDPRGFKVHTILPPTEEERFRPPMWRFWTRLPADGTIGVFDRSWYREVLEDRVEEEGTRADCQPVYERIRRFERQLADDGVVIVKFFLHISKKEQSSRFKKLKKDPAYSWKVGKHELRQHKRYDEHLQAVEDMLVETSTPYAPWTVVPATDKRFRELKVAETLLAAFEQALLRTEPPVAPQVKEPVRRTSPLDRVKTSVALSRDKYDKELEPLQDELRRLQHLCYVRRTPVVIVYEGWDASGKGGNIRRLTKEMDPRGLEVVPIAAPQGDEKTHHYLWRFWRPLPKAGHIAIFDRSWYGRVLVERVEGFAKPEEWQRAYREINEFESELVECGVVLIKFWFHISKEVQLQRFNDRQAEPSKHWKITDEDWRNRKRWDDYWLAASDMLERTSTTHAPWIIIEGDDKYHARVKTVRVVVERLKPVVDKG
ncbi:MAG: polyphosphate:AMP phosphotransferase [Candidatus Hydrogenedentes bacterium]|nr:polyphosphate:AMP phosphotransferase [Candidatus Hydrogenedentota bacterium]